MELPKIISPLPEEKILKVLKPVRPWAFLGYYFIGFLLLALGILALLYLSVALGLVLVLIGALISVATYFYSGAFTYFLTNKRIVIYRKFITISSRQIQYDDLSDVVVDVGIIGRIFGFGSVIPITKSGLGLGSTGVYAGTGTSRGGIVVGGPAATVVRPVASPSTCLYGIREPFVVKDLIFKYQEEYAEAPYLKKIAKAVSEKPAALAGARFCPFCGGKLVEGGKFCPSCGKGVS